MNPVSRILFQLILQFIGELSNLINLGIRDGRRESYDGQKEERALLLLYIQSVPICGVACRLPSAVQRHTGVCRPPSSSSHRLRDVHMLYNFGSHPLLLQSLSICGQSFKTPIHIHLIFLHSILTGTAQRRRMHYRCMGIASTSCCFHTGSISSSS